VRKKTGILWSLMLVLGVVLMAGGCGSGIGDDPTGQRVDFDRLNGSWVIVEDGFEGFAIMTGEHPITGDQHEIRPFIDAISGSMNIMGASNITDRTGSGHVEFRLHLTVPSNIWYPWSPTFVPHLVQAPVGFQASGSLPIFYMNLDGGGHFSMTPLPDGSFRVTYNSTGVWVSPVTDGNIEVNFSSVAFTVRRQ